jgi:acetylornithine deacetylase/succinyl-diaminopimelate desuccinylase-like protein
VVTQRLRINRHLQFLVGERHPETSPRALRKAAHYLTTQFAKSGWTTSGQLVHAWGKVYRNVVATKYPDRPGQGEALPPLLIGAHYDTVSGSPGADDNASGLVVLLEVATRLRAQPLTRPVWLVAFCLEEQDRLGSQAFASRLKAGTLGRAAGPAVPCCFWLDGRVAGCCCFHPCAVLRSHEPPSFCRYTFPFLSA